MRRDESLERVKVGVFLAAGVALVLAILVVTGRSQRPFSRKVTLHASFQNAAGLTVGAPVRLGGVDIGAVQAIDFSSELGVKEVAVTLRVQERFLPRIRTDSRATLTPKGLLGDTFVTITVGSPEAAPLRDGARVAAGDNEGLGQMMASVQGGLDEIRSLSRGLRGHLDALVTPEATRDLGRLLHAAAGAAEEIESGDGLAHALVYDQTLARDARTLLRDAGRSTAELRSALARIDRVAAVVEEGDGTLHRLVYRDDAGPVIADAQRAARELADAATEIRQGKGPLHALVYGRDGDELLANLTRLSRTLGRIGDDVARGKGTLGALLQDPSVYEDLKIILRDVKRNTLLKAVVRYTIERDRLQR